MPTTFKKTKSAESKQLLGSTIGIYGDSFAVRPRVGVYKGKRKLRSSGANEDASDLEFMRPHYLRNDWATPQHNLHGIAWWTYQISQHFETPIHYGTSGTSPEHMIYSQIDVNNNFKQMFPEQPLAENVVPDVMIMCWSDPIRVYVDPYQWFYQEKILSGKEIYWINTRGSPANFNMINSERFFENGWLSNANFRRFSTMIKHHTQLTSDTILYHRNLGLKIMFDQRWHPQLKKINPNLKVIHFDCFKTSTNLDHTFKNGIWVKDFPLEMLERAEGELIIRKLYNDPDWTKNICHMPFQKQHNFMTNLLIDLIHNYHDLDANFDFSNWKDQYKML